MIPGSSWHTETYDGTVGEGNGDETSVDNTIGIRRCTFMGNNYMTCP